MDWQTVLPVSVTVASAITGWFVRVLWQANVEHRRDLRSLADSLPATYLRRDDFNAHAQRVEHTLIRIEAKLDSKADK